MGDLALLPSRLVRKPLDSKPLVLPWPAHLFQHTVVLVLLKQRPRPSFPAALVERGTPDCAPCAPLTRVAPLPPAVPHLQGQLHSRRPRIWRAPTLRGHQPDLSSKCVLVAAASWPGAARPGPATACKRPRPAHSPCPPPASRPTGGQVLKGTSDETLAALYGKPLANAAATRPGSASGVGKGKRPAPADGDGASGSGRKRANGACGCLPGLGSKRQAGGRGWGLDARVGPRPHREPLLVSESASTCRPAGHHACSRVHAPHVAIPWPLLQVATADRRRQAQEAAPGRAGSSSWPAAPSRS